MGLVTSVSAILVLAYNGLGMLLKVIGTVFVDGCSRSECVVEKSLEIRQIYDNNSAGR